MQKVSEGKKGNGMIKKLYKTINLERDHVFSHSEEYNDTHGYSLRQAALQKRFEETREAILDLVLRGKLDKTDLAIIDARSGSPMPSNRQIAKMLGIPRRSVDFKLARLKGLIGKEIK